MRPKEFAAQERGASLKGTELTACMAAFLANFLRQHGLSEKQAAEISLDLMAEMSRHYGGQNVYFARDMKQKNAARADEIYDRFSRNELSLMEITQEYGISLQWVYHLLRTVRVQRREARDAAAAEKRADEAVRHKRENA